MSKSVLQLLLLTLACSLLRTSYSQYAQIPQVSCPKYFRYLDESGTIVGELTLYNISNGTTKVDVHLSQRTPLQSSYFGQVTLYQDQQTTIKNIENGRPITYRIDFPLPHLEVPKLTYVAVGGSIICRSNDYAPPSTSIKLQHTLSLRIEREQHQYLTNYNALVSVPSKAAASLSKNALSSNNNYNGRPSVIQMPTKKYYRQPIGTPASQSIAIYPREQYTVPRPSQVAQEQYTAPRPSQVAQEQYTAPRPSQVAQEQYTAPTRQWQAPTYSRLECGQEGPDTNRSPFRPFIHRGVQLRRGEYPWLTAIYGKEETDAGIICGGSLIGARTVLTAAHCITDSGLSANDYEVYLGRYDLTNIYEQNYVRLRIVSVRVHPEFKKNTFSDADLALMYMEAPVSFTDFIKPICLWSETDDQSKIIGADAMVAGWGMDEYDNYQMIPKKVMTTVVSESDCLRSSAAYGSITSQRTICAGKRDYSGPCTGDSGGGLIMNRDNRWVLRGVVSVGQVALKHCQTQEYVVYCDVAKHLQWVQKNTH